MFLHILLRLWLEWREGPKAASEICPTKALSSLHHKISQSVYGGSKPAIASCVLA